MVVDVSVFIKNKTSKISDEKSYLKIYKIHHIWGSGLKNKTTVQPRTLFESLVLKFVKYVHSWYTYLFLKLMNLTWFLHKPCVVFYHSCTIENSPVIFLSENYQRRYLVSKNCFTSNVCVFNLNYE